MAHPGPVQALPLRGRRLVLAIVGFSVLLLVSLFMLRACRDSQPRPRFFPWSFPGGAP